MKKNLKKVKKGLDSYGPFFVALGVNNERFRNNKRKKKLWIKK